MDHLIVGEFKLSLINLGLNQTQQDEN